MPILKEEPSHWPADLFDQRYLKSQQKQGATWSALYTRSRQEKSLLRELSEAELPCYCPLVPHHSRSVSGRRRTSHLPLFASYVFVLADSEALRRAAYSDKVVSTIDVPDQRTLLREFLQIERLRTSGKRLTIEAALAEGAAVRVKTGPFKGVEGRVVRRDGADCLQVQVGVIHCGATLAIEDWKLESL